MTTTRISPRQVEIGPLPEEELPPIVQAGAVWRNGRLVGGTLPAPHRTSVPEQSLAAQQEQQAAQRRLVDLAALRADPTFVYALWRWVQMQTAAPGYGDVAAWMDEGQHLRQQQALDVMAQAVQEAGRHDHPDADDYPKPLLSKKQTAALAKARAARAAKRAMKLGNG